MSEYTYLCAYSIQTRYYTGTVSAIYCIRLHEHRESLVGWWQPWEQSLDGCDSAQTVGTTWLLCAVFYASGTRSSNRNMVQYTQLKKGGQVGVRGGNWNAYEHTNKVVLPRIQNAWFIYRECLYINPCFHEFMPFLFLSFPLRIL